MKLIAQRKKTRKDRIKHNRSIVVWYNLVYAHSSKLSPLESSYYRPWLIIQLSKSNSNNFPPVSIKHLHSIVSQGSTKPFTHFKTYFPHFENPKTPRV